MCTLNSKLHLLLLCARVWCVASSVPLRCGLTAARQKREQLRRYKKCLPEGHFVVVRSRRRIASMTLLLLLLVLHTRKLKTISRQSWKVSRQHTAKTMGLRCKTCESACRNGEMGNSIRCNLNLFAKKIENKLNMRMEIITHIQMCGMVGC